MHGSVYISADTLDDTFFKKDEIGLWTLATKDWGNNPDKNSLNIRLYSSNIQNFYVSKYLSLKNKQTKRQCEAQAGTLTDGRNETKWRCLRLNPQACWWVLSEGCLKMRKQRWFEDG